MKTATVWAVMPGMPDFSARLEVCWNYYPSSPRREVVQYAKAGLLVPLDEYLTREDWKDFVPKALEYFTYEDELWAFPWAFGNNGMGITNLIYPPMFEEAGVDWKKIVEKGWTMDEFVAVGKKISQATSIQTGPGFTISAAGFSMKRKTRSPSILRKRLPDFSFSSMRSTSIKSLPKVRRRRTTTV